jgi:hypothetical protein
MPVINAFMNGRVTLVSVPGVKDLSGGFHPLIISKGDVNSMVVFTSIDRVSSLLGDNPDHLFAEMTGMDVVRGAADGVGLAINPGSDLGMEVLPQLVTQLKASLSR